MDLEVLIYLSEISIPTRFKKQLIYACRRLEHFGFQVDYLPVDKQGVVSCEDLVKFIKGNTELISVMMVNALRDMSKPIGVSEYHLCTDLPLDLKNALPAVEDIRSRIDMKK